MKQSEIEKKRQYYIATIKKFKEENERYPTPKELAVAAGDTWGAFRYFIYSVLGSESKNELCFEAIGTDYPDGRIKGNQNPKRFNLREPGTIGDFLTELRLEKKLSQAQLSRKTGLERRLISEQERGLREIDEKSLIRYSWFYGIKKENILNYQNNKRISFQTRK